MVTPLDPESNAFFATSKKRVNRAFDFGMDQSRLQRSNASISQRWKRSDIRRQYAQQRSRIPWNYAARGTLNSGIHKDARIDFYANRKRDLSRALTMRDRENTAFNVNDYQLALAKGGAHEDLQTQRTGRQQAIAASLLGFG